MSDMMVQNQLDQSDLGKLQEILAMVQSLLQGAAPEAAIEEPTDMGAVEMATPPDDTEMQEVEVEKAVTDETGDSKAEERLANVTELTDSSLSEIGKAIIAAVNKSKTVQKPVNPLTKAVIELTTVVKAMAEKFDNQEKFNDQLMKGLGFSETVVEKALEEDTKPKQRPVQNSDSELILKSIMELAKNSNANPNTKNPWNDKRGVNKNINTLLNSLNAGQK